VFHGTCIPRAAAGDQGDALIRGGCPADDPGLHPEQQDDFVCVPNEKVEDPSYLFPSCQTVDNIPLPPDYNNMPGACLRDCFIDWIITLGFGQGSCEPGETCAPCINPLNGEPSGACL
jgi:hypothetical protein